jgi:hypothetical protein
MTETRSCYIDNGLLRGGGPTEKPHRSTKIAPIHNNYSMVRSTNQNIRFCTLTSLKTEFGPSELTNCSFFPNSQRIHMSEILLDTTKDTSYELIRTVDDWLADSRQK